MTERPILFSAPMVRAILAGTKTQTRRAVKLRGADCIEEREDGRAWPWSPQHDEWVPCLFGAPGDRLWVRETWAAPHDCDHLKPTEIPEGTRIHPRASWDGPSGLLWRPSIHMPRWASRITLEVTGVRVERLRDISEADARAEGVETEWTTEAGEHMTCTAREAFGDLWESINGAGSWAANPWVCVVEFKRVTP